jgi:hypothetical protein
MNCQINILCCFRLSFHSDTGQDSYVTSGTKLRTERHLSTFFGDVSRSSFSIFLPDNNPNSESIRQRYPLRDADDAYILSPLSLICRLLVDRRSGVGRGRTHKGVSRSQLCVAPPRGGSQHSRMETPYGSSVFSDRSHGEWSF